MNANPEILTKTVTIAGIEKVLYSADGGRTYSTCPSESTEWQARQALGASGHDPAYDKSIRARTHGKSHRTEYRAFHSMIRHAREHGIPIEPRWERSFVHFEEDMGAAPGDGYALTRLEKKGPYSKANCAWRLPQRTVEALRRRYNVKGRRKTLPQWAEAWGVELESLCELVFLGVPLSEARLKARKAA